MALILMRHGEAEHPGSADERGLTDKGQRDAESVADQLFEAGYEVGILFHSGKKRAAQTAEVLAHRIGRGAHIEKVIGLGPHDDVSDIARRARQGDPCRWRSSATCRT